jgi:hypothetical protein
MSDDFLALEGGEVGQKVLCTPIQIRSAISKIPLDKSEKIAQCISGEKRLAAILEGSGTSYTIICNEKGNSFYAHDGSKYSKFQSVRTDHEYDRFILFKGTFRKDFKKLDLLGLSKTDEQKDLSGGIEALISSRLGELNAMHREAKAKKNSNPARAPRIEGLRSL